MGGSTKQALLQALSAAEGAYISGQQLAEALGVSRAAVHKAAQALSAQGYALDSAPRRGYRLAGGDPFCAEAVGPYPAPIHIYDTLQSSNLTAKQLALGGAPHGTLVLTAHQQAGRGRLGRRFESPAGKGVYLSLILRPALSAAAQALEAQGAEVIFAPGTVLEISSTQVRAMAARGGDISHLVPPGVRRVILREGLYCGGAHIIHKEARGH